MAYVKTVWTNGVTALEKINMDHLETQYDEAKAYIDTFQRWTLLETLSPAAAASIDSAALTAYDMAMVVIRLRIAAAATLYLQLNNDVGANYAFQCISGGAFGAAAAQNNIQLAIVGAAGEIVGVLYLPGKLGAVSVPITADIAGGVATADLILNNAIYAAGANITVFNFSLSASTMTGKIEIYGKNFA